MRRATVTALAALAAAVSLACLVGPGGHPVVMPDAAPSADQMAELWVEPERERDLYYGVGGPRLAPDPDLFYTVTEVKVGGFSEGYDVEGPDGRDWSAKFPPEAPTEVVASRIHWGIGYHQPPIYLLLRWQAEGADRPNPQLPARFREDEPDLHGLEDEGDWSFYENPFVGTRQLNALLALQAMLGNSDLKASNNTLFALDAPFEGAARWYVVRDIGQAFGRSGTFDPPRGDIDVFERTGFIRSVSGDRVELEYAGRHAALFEHIRVDDVVWLCRQLDRLTDRQWSDAFRAGGYEPLVADRFIRRMKEKIAEGLAIAR